jgi:hypothetical protein
MKSLRRRATFVLLGAACIAVGLVSVKWGFLDPLAAIRRHETAFHFQEGAVMLAPFFALVGIYLNRPGFPRGSQSTYEVTGSDREVGCCR